MTSRLLLLALAAATGLSACGRQGDLERPAPLFGTRAKAEYEAAQRAQAAQQSGTATPAPNRSSGMEPASRNVPATREPIDGSNDPVGRRPTTDQNRPG